MIISVNLYIRDQRFHIIQDMTSSLSGCILTNWMANQWSCNYMAFTSIHSMSSDGHLSLLEQWPVDYQQSWFWNHHFFTTNGMFVLVTQVEITVYWISGVNLSQWKCLQHQIFILHRNLSAEIPNSDIIATQVDPHNENGEHFPLQIISSMLYFFFK